MISEVNEEKRVTWCLHHVTEGDLDFHDAIWTNECSIQLETHQRISSKTKIQNQTERKRKTSF